MTRVRALAEAGTTSLKRAFVRASVMLFVLVAFGTALASTAIAQNTPRLVVKAPTLTTPATVAVVAVLADRKFDELMRNGWPVHVHVTAEMWQTGRVFDVVTARAEWDLIVRFDTFDSNYEVARITPDSIIPLGAFKKLAEARAAAELAYAPPLGTPPRGRESYVSVRADVESIEMSDLQQLQRWLNGEARPAVQGKKNPGTAIVRGLRSLVTRLLGGEVRHIDGRSPTFVL